MSEAPTLSTPPNIPCQSTNTSPGNENGIPEDKVRNFVSQLLDSLIDELMGVDGCPSITLKRRSNHSHFSLNPETGALQRDTTEPSCTYSWPGKTAQEAWRFGAFLPTRCCALFTYFHEFNISFLSYHPAVLLRILGHISEAIRGDFISSKRDIYYLDPVCFGSQSVVDRCIDDIACTIGVDRTALHVVL